MSCPAEQVSADDEVWVEAWEDEKFIPGLSIETFDGASFSVEDGTLVLSGNEAGSKVVINVPSGAEFLEMARLDHSLPTGAEVQVEWYADFGQGTAITGSAGFESTAGDTTLNTCQVKDKQGNIVGAVPYKSPRYVLMFPAKKVGDNWAVDVQLREQDGTPVGGLATFTYPKVESGGAPVDYKRIEILLGPHEFQVGAIKGLVSNPCPQDLDGNGLVDAADLAQILGAWGPCPG